MYNFEAVDQDFRQLLPPDARLTPEWREDFLGGVTVITGTFADGSPMLAIPNYARENRAEGTYGPRRPEPRADGGRGEPFPVTSVVWMREG